MFAPRFDPNAVYEETRVPVKLVSRKRKLEAAQIKDSSDDSSSDSEDEKTNEKSESSSDSDDDNSSSESSSSSESESESDSEIESKPEPDAIIDTALDVVSHTDQESTIHILQSAPAQSTAVPTENIAENSNFPEPSTTNPEKTGENEDNGDDMDIDPSDAEASNNDTQNSSVHSKVLKKFARSTEFSKKNTQSDSESDTEMADVKELAPLPQPELPRDQNLKSHHFHQKNLEWLASPKFATPEVTKPFSEFGLSEKMMHNLKSEGFTDAFSVQVAVLDTVLADLRKNALAPDFQGDVLVNASTGSGKTLAYSIPIIEALHTRVVPRLRAVVLVPTRPLVGQVAATMRGLASGTTLAITTLSDKSVREETARMAKNEPDIVVSTPGRLVDHLLKRSLSLKSLRFLVVDEADRLLGESFQNWCEVVVGALEEGHKPEDNISTVWRLQPQKMVFSATLTTDAGKLSLLKFHKPRLLVVNANQQLTNESFSVPSLLTEHRLRFRAREAENKPLLLARFLIDTGKLRSVLVFAKSNDATLRLTRILSDLFAALAPASNTSVAYLNATNNVSGARRRILKDFADGDIGVLVATDLIARGLDVSHITCVVNYDLPNSSREYVHRVGRTARANQRGEAITMCFGGGESGWFRKIADGIGRANPVEVINGEDAVDSDKVVYARVMAKFQEDIREGK